MTSTELKEISSLMDEDGGIVLHQFHEARPDETHIAMVSEDEDQLKRLKRSAGGIGRIYSRVWSRTFTDYVWLVSDGADLAEQLEPNMGCRCSNTWRKLVGKPERAVNARVIR